MKIAFQPFPDDVPPVALKKFIHWVNTQPGFAEKMQAHYQSMLAQPPTPENREMQGVARVALLKLQHYQAVDKVQRRLQYAKLLLEKGSGRVADPIQRLESLVQEITEYLPAVQEPDLHHINIRAP